MKKNLLNLLGLGLVAATLSFQACTPDPCKDITCNNGGTCVEGTCDCPSGYEATDPLNATDCSVETRARFIGSYLMSGTDNAVPQNTYSNVSATIAASGTAVDKILFAVPAAGLSLPAKVTSTGFTFDETTVSGYTYTGNATLASGSTTITMVLTEVENVTPPVTLVYNWTGVKQ